MNQDKIGRWTAAALVCGFFIWWISAIPTPTRQPGLVNAAEPVSTPAEHPAGGPILYIQHETEARRFLRDCNQKRPGDRQECLRLQRTFVIVYVGSFTGGFFQIVTLAAALSSPTSRNYMKQVAPAVRPDPIESCAWWKLLSLTTAHNPAYDATYHRNCDLLSGDSIQTRFRQIAPQLGDQSKPPPDWDPKIDGLRDR